MLLNLREYYRPDETDGLALAIELLSRPTIRTVPLAGGDTLIGSGDPSVEAVVDLQSLGLDVIEAEAAPHGGLKIGAMTTRAALAESEFVRLRCDGILAAGARRWSGNIQRNRATLGGALATAAANDPLVIALLVCDAVIAAQTSVSMDRLPIVEFLIQRSAILTRPALVSEIRVPRSPAPTTGYALADVARTPADAPIVVAAAALTVVDGRCTQARLALGGAASDPVRLPAAEALLEGQALTAERIADAAARARELVSPDGDFRGSAEYRKAMAGVLAERVLRQAWERTA
jgi:carbon-monoxide dehydrogenase medium subunit